MSSFAIWLIFMWCLLAAVGVALYRCRDEWVGHDWVLGKDGSVLDELEDIGKEDWFGREAEIERLHGIPPGEWSKSDVRLAWRLDLITQRNYRFLTGRLEALG
jgi:hypothetical protein